MGQPVPRETERDSHTMQTEGLGIVYSVGYGRKREGRGKEKGEEGRERQREKESHGGGEKGGEGRER